MLLLKFHVKYYYLLKTINSHWDRVVYITLNFILFHFKPTVVIYLLIYI